MATASKLGYIFPNAISNKTIFSFHETNMCEYGNENWFHAGR